MSSGRFFFVWCWCFFFFFFYTSSSSISEQKVAEDHWGFFFFSFLLIAVRWLNRQPHTLHRWSQSRSSKLRRASRLGFQLWLPDTPLKFTFTISTIWNIFSGTLRTVSASRWLEKPCASRFFPPLPFFFLYSATHLQGFFFPPGFALYILQGTQRAGFYSTPESWRILQPTRVSPLFLI